MLNCIAVYVLKFSDDLSTPRVAVMLYNPFSAGDSDSIAQVTTFLKSPYRRCGRTESTVHSRFTQASDVELVVSPVEQPALLLRCSCWSF